MEQRPAATAKLAARKAPHSARTPPPRRRIPWRWLRLRRQRGKHGVGGHGRIAAQDRQRGDRQDRQRQHRRGERGQLFSLSKAESGLISSDVSQLRQRAREPLERFHRVGGVRPPITRRITNVADGTAATYAVNLRQLQSGLTDTLNQANSFTDSQLRLAGQARPMAASPRRYRQAACRKRSVRAISSSAAASEAGAAPTVCPIGGSAALDDHVAVKAGASFDAHGGAGFNAGFGYQF